MTCWIVRDPAGDAGWEFGLPPGITPEQWPRHRSSGLPLVHGFTIRVPEELRVKGPQRVALSYFHPGDSESFPAEEGQVARVRAILDGGPLEGGEAGHPFWEALHACASSEHVARSARTAGEARLAVTCFTDILEHDHVVVWHTERELGGPRCERPETPLPDGIDGEAVHLDEPVPAEVPLGLVETEPEQILIQLGPPLRPVQSSEDALADMGFGEMVLQIETDVGGANYGDGNCQVDLENGLLDWACT